MNPKELRTALKPIVKELVYECLIKEGILSSVVSEVMKGAQTVAPIVTEQRIPQQQPKKQVSRLESNEEAIARRKKLEETLMSKIGVNVFEGTKPLSNKAALNESTTPDSKASPLAGIDPSDSGVDISGLLRLTGGWKQL
jgi:hypothetical protein